MCIVRWNIKKKEVLLAGKCLNFVPRVRESSLYVAFMQDSCVKMLSIRTLSYLGIIIFSHIDFINIPIS